MGWVWVLSVLAIVLLIAGIFMAIFLDGGGRTAGGVLMIVSALIAVVAIYMHFMMKRKRMSMKSGKRRKSMRY
jgi:predicted membrane channel-forming protein YqfA (hemolysin III family)